MKRAGGIRRMMASGTGMNGSGWMATMKKAAASGSDAYDDMDYNLPCAGITSREFDGMTYQEVKEISRETIYTDIDKSNRADKEIMERSKILMKSPKYDPYREIGDSDLCQIFELKGCSYSLAGMGFRYMAIIE